MKTKLDGATTPRVAAAPRLAAVTASALAAGLITLLAVPSAQAQIKQPGAHPDYSVELEPHLVFQWDHGPWDDTGIGLGARASIPFLDNGPIDTINNNMAIGFGLDWAHFSDACWSYYWGGAPWYDPGDPRYAPYAGDCSGDHFWFPVVLQWNFFLTDIISVFGEPGLAIVHESYDGWIRCASPTGWCEHDYGDTDVRPVFFAGGRFLFSDNIGLVVRLGWPYISIGPTFML